VSLEKSCTIKIRRKVIRLDDLRRISSLFNSLPEGKVKYSIKYENGEELTDSDFDNVFNNDSLEKKAQISEVQLRYTGKECNNQILCCFAHGQYSWISISADNEDTFTLQSHRMKEIVEDIYPQKSVCRLNNTYINFVFSMALTMLIGILILIAINNVFPIVEKSTIYTLAILDFLASAFFTMYVLDLVCKAWPDVEIRISNRSNTKKQQKAIGFLVVEIVLPVVISLLTSFF